MAVRKEKSPLELFRDLLIKINHCYSDMYVYKGKYCIPGPTTLEDGYGSVLLELDKKYMDVLRTLQVDGIIYVEDIRALKDTLDPKKAELVEKDWAEYITRIKDEATEGYLLEHITSVEKDVNEVDNIFKRMIDYPEMLVALYDKSAIYNLPVDNDGATEYVTVAKQLFPIITKKSAETAFICIRKADDYEGLYKILVDFNFTHFRFEAVYHALPVPEVTD